MSSGDMIIWLHLVINELSLSENYKKKWERNKQFRK